VYRFAAAVLAEVSCMSNVSMCQTIIERVFGYQPLRRRFFIGYFVV